MGISSAICYGGYDLGLGTLNEPGSGFIFFWVGIIMIGLSMGIFIRALVNEGRLEGEEKLWEGIQWWKLISVGTALVFYVYAFTSLGFILSTILLLTFLFKGIGPQPWLRSIFQAVLSALITYVVFSLWLGVQFPRGFLGIG
jgi:putative tricarboxylic transport membrane protein